jgi:glycosyltransferase involved in cell wall biosynthesis
LKKSVAIISPARFPGTAGDTANFMEIIDQLTSENIQPILICPKSPKSKSNNGNQYSKLKIIRIPCVPPRLKDLKNKIGIRQRISLLYFLLIESIVVIWTLKRTGVRSVFMRHSILTIQLPFILKVMGIKIVADGELVRDSLGSLVSGASLKILYWYELKAIRKYSYFKVSTNAHAKSLSLLGYPESQIVLIPVSVNIDRIPKFKVENIPPHTFGYFGVLERWQGVDILIESFKILASKISSARLYIIGEGSIEEELKKTVAKYELSDNITFVSPIPREDLWKQYFNKFQIVVIPRPKQNSSIDYVLPIKLVESLAAGKPIIAMDIPAMREIPSNAIVLASSSNPVHLAECMENLTSNTSFLTEISRNASSFASTFDIKVNIRRLSSILCGN